MTNKKALTVVIPTYNGEKFLSQQIDSILKQTLKPDRILILDDHSTDSTLKILSKYNKHSQIEIHDFDNNVGVVENLKRAIPLLSNNEYIALADQDDIWDIDKLEITYSELLNLEMNHTSTSCIVFTDARAISESNEVLFDSYFKEIKWNYNYFTLESIFINGGIIGSASLMNYSMFQQLKNLDNNFKIYHDEWFLFISFTFGKKVFIDKSTISHRKHANSLTFHNRHPKNTLLSRILLNLKFIISSKSLLHDRIITAKCFLAKYQNLLSRYDIDRFNKFIRLHNKSYFIKKIYIRKHIKLT